MVLQVELPCQARRHAAENACVCWKRKRNASELVDSHSGTDGDCRDLRDLDRPFADDLTTENLARRAIDDQFAKAERAAVYDRARGRIEVDGRGRYIVRCSGLRFGQAHEWHLIHDKPFCHLAFDLSAGFS